MSTCARFIHTHINTGVPAPDRVPLGRVLDAIARELRLKDWNAAAARLKSGLTLLGDPADISAAVSAALAKPAADVGTAGAPITRVFRFDWLKRALRSIPGIPNADYLVNDDGSVFVFEKLCDEVTKARDADPEQNIQQVAQKLQTLALKVMADKRASVAALEAVTD